MKRALILATCAVLFAGCGGGGSSAGSTIATTNAFDTAGVLVTVAIPRGTSSTARSAQYVSQGTASMSVTVSGATTSANCAAPATSCSVQVAAPLGSDMFAVSLFDASSNLLASGSATSVVTANVLNTVNLTFDGVIHSLSATLSSPTITLGAAASSTLTIVAKDAAGDTIVPPGNYTQPILVTTTPSSLPASLSLTGATTISTIPSSNSTLSVGYTGAATGTSSVVFTATAGAATGSATLTFPTPGGVVISPSSLQFTTIPASAQTATVSETNYAGTFSVTTGCGATATLSAITAGVVSVTPNTVGSCTAIISDTLGNVHHLTINVATTAITGS